MSTTVRLRPIEPADHAFVLALNTTHQHVTAPMDADRLAALLGWADRADVIEVDGERAGMVLLFAPGSDYDSASYVSFCAQFEAFTYLDRIVVDEAFQRRGVGSAVYDLLEPLARERLVLEVNLDPPNEASLAFHRARGYRDLGVLGLAGKQVLQMVKEVR